MAIEIKTPSGGGSVVPIPGTTNKVYIVPTLAARDALIQSIENDFCQVLNTTIPFDSVHPVIGYFIRTALPISDPGAWIQIKTSQAKFDAGYLILVVANDIELNEAILLLNANESGGTILLKQQIYLSADYSWNLDNIKIDGRSHNFWIQGHPFTITSRTCRFYDTWFTGSQDTNPANFLTQRMCYINNQLSDISSLDYLFEGCQWVRMIGTGLTPVFDIDCKGYLKITFKRCIAIVQDITFTFEALNINFIGLRTINIIVQESGGTTAGSNNFRATGNYGSLTPTEAYNFFVTDGSAALVTASGLALTEKYQTSTLGTKKVIEGGITDKTMVIYDIATNSYKVIETANISIIDFGNTVLADEKYWRNNFTSSLAPAYAGQTVAGTGNLGTYMEVMASSGGFVRVYSQPYIDSSSGYGATLAGLLQTSTGWVDGLKIISNDADGRNGDIGMKHKFGEFTYECIGRTGTGNNDSIWQRTQNKDAAVLPTDKGVLFSNATGQVNQSTSFIYDSVTNILTVGNFILTVVEYADNAAAVTGGLIAGNLYRTGDQLKIVH